MAFQWAHGPSSFINAGPADGTARPIVSASTRQQSYVAGGVPREGFQLPPVAHHRLAVNLRVVMAERAQQNHEVSQDKTRGDFRADRHHSATNQNHRNPKTRALPMITATMFTRGPAAIMSM